MRFRKGIGLSNKACEKWDKKNNCTEYKIITYDLNDQKVRQDLISFNFICMAGNFRYKICPDQAAFCHTEYETKLIIFKKKKISILSITDEDYLINSGTTCYSQERDRK